jgi:NitT/TauT family transport system permease protein
MGVDGGAAEERELRLEAELTGLDALETAPVGEGPGWPMRIWSAAWPGLTAVLIALGLWQAVVSSGWKPEYVLPSPFTVIRGMWRGELVDGMRITLRRAATGFALAVAIGTVVGLALAQVRVLRRAFGAFITGLQTMPSIVWFPLAITLFKLSESAILFVVVIGAAPSIANGLLAGFDALPPLWLRVGRVLGARGLRLTRHVVLPGTLPAYVAGLKQGWAFSWRSLMAGELLVIIGGEPSLGFLLDRDRTLADAVGLQSTMLLVLIIGIVVDRAVFGVLERTIARRRGLTGA